MLTPEKLGSTPTEDAQQMATMQWAALNTPKYPQLKWLHAIPNSGVFGNDQRTRTIRASKMKALGMKPGVHDLFLPYPNCGYHGLYIEMKRPETETQKAGKASEDQMEFADFVWNNGYYCVFCYSWIEATNIIKQYLEGALECYESEKF